MCCNQGIINNEYFEYFVFPLWKQKILVHRKIWTEIKAAETKAEAALYYNTTSLLAIVPIHDSAATDMKWEVGARSQLRQVQLKNICWQDGHSWLG